MARGKFKQAIKIPTTLKLRDENVDRVTRFKNGIEVTFDVNYYNLEEYARKYITVMYFGKVKGGRIHLTSFSYSVQHLPKDLQEQWNRDPYYTAKYGLEVIGVAF